MYLRHNLATLVVISICSLNIQNIANDLLPFFEKGVNSTQ